jgi:hypothetical protein
VEKISGHRKCGPNGESNMRILVLTAAFVLFFFSQARADIRITEVMSQSSSGAGGTPDWFEVTNFGSSAVNITGWKMDDGSFSLAAAVALNGVSSIGAGESVVFVEGGDLAATDAFKSFWFSTPPTGLQVGYYSGSGVSFSSGGDGTILFDSTNNAVWHVNFGVATTGKTFDNSLGTFGAAGGAPFNSAAITTISQSGVNGAFQSNNSLANVGSPGAVPEPSALGLLAVAGVIAGGLRRKRS